MSLIQRLRYLLLGHTEPGWMYYDSYGNDWERVDTHHAYTIEGETEGGTMIDKYQIHEYYHSGKKKGQLAGFKTGTQKIEDPDSLDGDLESGFDLYIAGLVGQEYVPLDSFDQEVTIT